MDEGAAREIAKASIRSMALLDQLAETLADRVGGDELEAVKLGIARAMGEISTELLAPALRQHPALEPGSREDWRKLGELDAVRWLG